MATENLLHQRDGNLLGLEPTEEGVKEVARVRLNDEEIWGAPIISRGRIYLATSKKLYCIGKEDSVVESDPLHPSRLSRHGLRTKPLLTFKSHGRSDACSRPDNALPGPSLQQEGTVPQSCSAEFTTEGGGTVTAEGNYTAPAQ